MKMAAKECYALKRNTLLPQSLLKFATCDSRQHLVCVTAKRVVDNPSSGPLTMLVRNLNAAAHCVIARLITTAYHVILKDQNFASFPRAIEQQQKNGVDLGTQVSS